jgi:hypothetical protein
MSIYNGDEPDAAAQEPGARPCSGCVPDRHLRVLAKNLESRLLRPRVSTRVAEGPGHVHAVTVTVTNPATPERGEFRIEHDGRVSWEFTTTIDDTGIRKVLRDVTNALREGRA